MIMKRVRITNESLNSYGFRVLTAGVDISQYQRNPVLLYMHERGKIIGYMKDLRVENGEITGEPVFDDATELSRQCKKQFEVGSLRMVSAGLDPIETSEAAELLVEGQTRPTLTKCRLVEVSLVDFGANDDAIVMKGDGTVIELGKNGDSTLPLLNNQLKEETMDLKAIALKLGLAETADESAILQKIAELQKGAGAAVTLRQENDTLKLAGIITLVDGAIAEKKIGADKKDHFIELGKKVGIEGLKSTFEAMSPRVKLSEMTHQGGGSGHGAGTYTKLSEVPGEELVKMRQDDKETYRRLYKAEYGMECEV